jgi:hypothetical protein
MALMETTLNSLRERVPAIFTKTPSPKVSNRYSFADSEYYLQKFIDADWFIHSARQVSKSEYAPHQVILRNKDIATVGDLLPQLIFTNSHNGIKKMTMDTGIYRLVCSNGLVVPTNITQSLSIKHIDLGDSTTDTIVNSFYEKIPIIMNNIDRMRNKILTNDEIDNFTYNALQIRFINAVGININDVVKPSRIEDYSDDLWTVFNVVQEKLIRGGIQLPSKRHSRPINNFVNDNNINTKLWQLAEQYI